MPACGRHFKAISWVVPSIFWKAGGTFSEWLLKEYRALTPSYEAEPHFSRVHSLTSLMVSRLTEELQAEAFYEEGWFKLVGSLNIPLI